MIQRTSRPDFLPHTESGRCRKQRCPALLGSYRKFDELAIIRLCIGRCRVCVWNQDGAVKGYSGDRLLLKTLEKGFE
ncbi:hypothetical protein TNCV_449221 [Trichonephila clavipes]|nr:hypothetical protein TNCV_449221 [Trichonephila clavipes]